MKKLFALGAIALLAGLAGPVVAQVVVPQVTSVNPGDLFQDIVNGAPAAGNQYASEALLNTYFGVGGASRGNALIGGDATTNLWQRATSGASQTTTVAYGGPDRWAYWSGASTAMTVSRDSTAADLPTGYKYAFKMARTSGQTGLVQMCVAQEVESVNSYQFAGQTAELDFNAYTGANYSGAATLTAYIIYGTGQDEGMTNLAFGLNAGGGGAAGWTGQTNATAAVIPLSAVSTAGRFAAIATVPATATEVAAAICYTPTGTAGTNDYIALDGIQLIRNGANANFANPVTGYNCATTANLTCAAFDRRQQQVETALQQRYFWQLNEPAAGVLLAPCGEITTAYMICTLKTPVDMRAAPTLTFSTQSTSTWEMFSASATPITLSGATSLIQNAFGANTVNTIGLKFTGAATPFTAGYAGELAGAGGGANMQASAEL